MSPRILIVEDQEDNRKILRDLLTSAGFVPLEATTGEDNCYRGRGAECRPRSAAPWT